jgi:hypothetical protein
MPVMILCGLRVLETPPLGGNALIHRFDQCISSMSMVSGITLNGKVCLVAHTRSLITRIYRSILGTCSFAAEVFSAIPADARLCFKGTNLPSMSMDLTRKPRAA